MPRVTLIFLACALWALPSFAETYRSSDFGWSEGMDITYRLPAKINAGTFRPGDELILDHTYRISGSHQFPNDFTLSAVQGAGLDVTDATPTSNHTFLELGHRNTLRNVTITYLNTPPPSPDAGNHPQRGVDFYPMNGIVASGKSDIRIEHCRLYGSINHQVKLTHCSSPQVVGTHIVGGFWSSYFTGDVTDAVYRNCVIEKCQGDGIKTGRAGGLGIKRVLVENCVFQDNARDGIDTTGGWKDSVIRNSIFRRCGLDLKSIYERPSDLSEDIRNTGILIENNHFIDTGNAIAISTIDRGVAYNGRHFLDAESAQEYAPHDIELIDNIFEITGTTNAKMLLVKGGHTVTYTNSRFLSGEDAKIQPYRLVNVFDTFGPGTLSEEASDALNHGVTGTLGLAGPPISIPGDTSVPFVYGPIPEPATISLMALPALCLLRRRRRGEPDEFGP